MCFSILNQSTTCSSDTDNVNGIHSTSPIRVQRVSIITLGTYLQNPRRRVCKRDAAHKGVVITFVLLLLFFGYGSDCALRITEPIVLVPKAVGCHLQDAYSPTEYGRQIQHLIKESLVPIGRRSRPTRFYFVLSYFGDVLDSTLVTILVACRGFQSLLKPIGKNIKC